ncbi:serine-rich adhesin for platelets-like [Littorina saxatilis]|uniref:TIR domain-containing protein n=1 Tax=Littorina saxatilis TaxID=31220 RepID=A0AAN9BT47_9CAEN
MSVCPFTLKNLKKKSKSQREETPCEEEEEATDDSSPTKKGCFGCFPTTLKDHHKLQVQSNNMEEAKSQNSTTHIQNTTDTNSPNRRPLAKGRVYHFNVIYNHARCQLSVTADTELALDWTRGAVERLQLRGLVNSYYHDRDCGRAQGLLMELARVIAGSEVTLVVLTRGFVRDCWPRYWFFSCFKSLFSPPEQTPSLSTSSPSISASGLSSPRHSSPRSSTSYSSSLSLYSTSGSSSPRTPPGGGSSPCGVVVVAIGLEPGDLPAGLRAEDVLFFSKDWRKDHDVWGRLEGSMMSALIEDCTSGDDLKIHAEQIESPRSATSESRTSTARDEFFKDLSPRTAGVNSVGHSSPRKREDQTDVTSDAIRDKKSATSPRSKEVKNDVTKEGSLTTNRSHRHSYPSYSGDSKKTGSGSSSSAKSQCDLITEKTVSEEDPNNTHSPRLQGSSPREQGSTQSLRLTATPLDIHGGFQPRDLSSSSKEESSSPRHVPLVRGMESRVEKLPSLEKSAMRVEEGPVAMLVRSPDSAPTGGQSRPSQVSGVQHVLGVKTDKDSDVSRDHTSPRRTDTSKKQQLAKEGPKPESNNNKTVHTTSLGGSDMESAVLDRLGQAAIRRESLSNTPFTRVFVKGNTVTVDHICTSGQGQRTANTQKRSTEGPKEQMLNDVCNFEAKDENVKMITVNSSCQSKCLLERKPDDRGSSNILQNQAHSLESSKRKTHSSAGRSSVLDSSGGTVASTDACDVPNSDSSTAETQAKDPQSDTTTYTPSKVLKRRAYTSSQMAPHQGHSRPEARELRCARDVANVDHGFQDAQTTITTSSALDRKHVAETKNNRAEPQGHPSRTDGSKTQSSSTNRQHTEPLPVLSARSSDKDKQKPATNDPQHLHDSVKLEIQQPKITAIEADPTSTDYHHITSVEDDHDGSLSDYLSTSLTTSDYGTMSPRNDLNGSDYLSTSLTTSDYGTMSPRNDLNGSRHGDSGFLSGESVSPRNSTPRSPGEKAEGGTKAAANHMLATEVSNSSSPKVSSSLTRSQKAYAESENSGAASVVKTLPQHSGSFQESTKSRSPNNNSTRRLATQTKEESATSSQSLKNKPQEPWMLATNMDTDTSSSDSGRSFHRESGLTTKHVEAHTTRAPSSSTVATQLSARASRTESDVFARKDSWIYEDVDKNWTLAEILLPFYHIICYALSTPEMPYF